MSTYNPTCPDDCSSLLNEVTFNECAPAVSFGQIDYVYLARREAASFVDWTSLTEWTARVSNDSVDPDAIRELRVIGSKDAPDRTPIEISGGRKVHPPATHTITFAIDEVNEDNYDFLRTLECNGYYKMWYSKGEYLYGGNDGIDIEVIMMYDEIPEDSKDLNRFRGTAEWEYQYHPERCANPMA